MEEFGARMRDMRPPAEVESVQFGTFSNFESHLSLSESDRLRLVLKVCRGHIQKCCPRSPTEGLQCLWSTPWIKKCGFSKCHLFASDGLAFESALAELLQNGFEVPGFLGEVVSHGLVEVTG